MVQGMCATWACMHALAQAKHTLSTAVREERRHDAQLQIGLKSHVSNHVPFPQSFLRVNLQGSPTLGLGTRSSGHWAERGAMAQST